MNKSPKKGLAITEIGSGPTIVCLHAIGHDHKDFLPLANKLKERFHFVLIDWPGHGQSADDGRPPRASDYAASIEQFLTQKGWSSVHVMGNSIGGAAAIDLAYRRPDLVKSLILCNSGGLAQIDPTVKLAVKTMVAFFGAGRRGAGWFERAFGWYYRLVLPKAPERRQEIVSNGRQMAHLLEQAWVGFGLPEADQRAQAAKLQMPVWVAWAKSDMILSLSRSRAAIAQIPHHELTLYEGGHSPFLEDLDNFSDKLGKIISY